MGATYLRDGGNDACVPLSQLVGIQNRPGGEAQSEVKGMTCAQVKTMYTCESALGSLDSVLIKRRCQLRLLRCFENLVDAIASKMFLRHVHVFNISPLTGISMDNQLDFLLFGIICIVCLRI